MKKYLFITVFVTLIVSITAYAQQETPLGRFIIGTTPVTYSMGVKTSLNQEETYNSLTNEYDIRTDSAHTTNNTLQAHISLFVGYFITKNICAGLQFGANSTGTYSTFIRYYFCHKNPDSAKFDFFFQANGTLSFSNTDNPAITNNYPFEEYSQESSYATTDYHTMENSWDIGVGIAAAYHLTRHWSLELEAGFTYANSVQTTGSYTATTLYYSSSNQIYNPTVDSYPGLKDKSYSDTGLLRFMLSYRI